MKKFIKNYGFNILFSVILALFFMYPNIYKDFLAVEHDTFFHISRIEGLATSIKEGVWIPRIYPYKNFSYGYASPTFYSDFFLLIPAILYNLGLNLSACYKIVLFFSSFFSCFFMMQLVKNLAKNAYSPYLAGFAYLFSSYRITDVYVRGSLGEVMAFVFLPIVIRGAYEILINDQSKWYYLVLGFGGLLLCHNLSFLIGCSIFFLLILIYHKNLMGEKSRFYSILKAAGITVGLCAFFLFPMLEGTTSIEMYLSYYASSSDLAFHALLPWQFIVNKTVFGLSGNAYGPDSTMCVNIGWFLTFAPLICLFKLKKKKDSEHKFIKTCLMIGYVFLFLPSSILPWKYFSFLRILQFPWRLETVALVLLTIPASIYPFELTKNIEKNRTILTVLLVLLSCEAIYHLQPCLYRTTGITSTTTYEDMITGKITNPYNSAWYNRIEVAGADYLPVDGPDFLTRSRCIVTDSNISLTCEYERQGTNLYFSVDYKGSVVLPITYYKGYQVYEIIDGNYIKCNTYQNPSDKLVAFESNHEGNYVCKYDGTFIQHVSNWISGITVLSTLIFIIRKKGKKHNNKRSAL